MAQQIDIRDRSGDHVWNGLNDSLTRQEKQLYRSYSFSKAKESSPLAFQTVVCYDLFRESRGLAVRWLYCANGAAEHGSHGTVRFGVGLVFGPARVAGKILAGYAGDSSVGSAAGTHRVGAVETVREARAARALVARAFRVGCGVHVAGGGDCAGGNVAAVVCPGRAHGFRGSESRV